MPAPAREAIRKALAKLEQQVYQLNLHQRTGVLKHGILQLVQEEEGRRARKNKTAVPKVSDTLRNIQTDIDQLLGRSARSTSRSRSMRTSSQRTRRACRNTPEFRPWSKRSAMPPAQPMTFRQGSRHAAENSLCLSAQPAHAGTARQFDIDQFTEQQKRVLAVFFQNKGMRMSYADVARV